MLEIQNFIENFTSALRMLGKTPEGGILDLLHGAGAFATGMPFAGENYALFNSCSSEEEVSKILDFFTEKEFPYISMQLPELKNEIRKALESRGLSIRAEYLAMSISCSSSGREPDPFVKIVSEKSDEKRWVEAVWTGFNGELPVPENYSNFAAYLSSKPENHLYYLEKEGVPLCSALLHSTDETCGLYYFATRPEARRQGLAARLMDTLIDLASLYSEDLVLLATEIGAKMYRNYGFKDLLKVPILSGSDEF